MASRAERAAATCDFVQRAIVNPREWGLSVLDWLQFEHGDIRVEFLGQGVVEQVLFQIPAGALEEEAVNVAAVFGLLPDLRGGLGIDYVVLETELVYGYLVLAGVVLQHAREEGLREEEAWGG